MLYETYNTAYNFGKKYRNATNDSQREEVNKEKENFKNSKKEIRDKNKIDRGFEDGLKGLRPNPLGMIKLK